MRAYGAGILERRRKGYSPPRVQGGGPVSPMVLSAPLPPAPAPAPTPASSLQPVSSLLQIEPVTFTFRVLGAAIEAQQLGPFPGPLIFHWMTVAYAASEIDPNTTDILIRLDVASVSGLDTFTFAVDSYPAGQSSSPWTLFEDQGIKTSEHLLPGLAFGDRKSTRLNSSHIQKSRMPSSA